MIDPPRTESELAQRLHEFRAELRSTPEARDAARFPLLRPPLPLAARAPYGVLSATAVAMLPLWARIPLPASATFWSAVSNGRCPRLASMLARGERR